MKLTSDNCTCAPLLSPSASTKAPDAASSSSSVDSNDPVKGSTTTRSILPDATQGHVNEADVHRHSHSPADLNRIQKNAADIQAEENDGHLMLILVVILSTLSVFMAIFFLVIYRNYQRRNITSLNFDNPVYRKTTEEQFVLEKSDADDSIISYPSSLEPLNSPGTNDFV
jgi:hypothetical protein